MLDGNAVKDISCRAIFFYGMPYVPPSDADGRSSGFGLLSAACTSLHSGVIML